MEISGEILYRLTEYGYDKGDRLITEKRYAEYQRKGQTEGRYNTTGRLNEERNKVSEGIYRRKVYFLYALSRIECMKEQAGEGPYL